MNDDLDFWYGLLLAVLTGILLLLGTLYFFGGH